MHKDTTDSPINYIDSISLKWLHIFFRLIFHCLFFYMFNFVWSVLFITIYSSPELLCPYLFLNLHFICFHFLCFVFLFFVRPTFPHFFATPFFWFRLCLLIVCPAAAWARTCAGLLGYQPAAPPVANGIRTSQHLPKPKACWSTCDQNPYHPWFTYFLLPHSTTWKTSTKAFSAVLIPLRRSKQRWRGIKTALKAKLLIYSQFRQEMEP